MMSKFSGKSVTGSVHSNRKRTILTFFLPAALTLVLPFLVTYFYLLPAQYNDLLEQKRELIKAAVDNALNIMKLEYLRAEEGRLTEEHAKEHMLELVTHLRWGPGDSYYLYLFTTDGILLAHPYNPELIGTDLRNVRDGVGRNLGELLLGAAETTDDPFLQYSWNKPNETEASRKLSYVRRLDVWGWVIGGGVYFDDIDTQYGVQKSRTVAFFSVIAVLTGILLSVMIRRGLFEEELRTRREEELRISEQKFRDIYDNTTTFIGLLDAEGRLLEINRTTTDFLRIHPDTVKGELLWDTPWWIADTEQQERIRQALESAGKKKQGQRFDTRHIAPGGREILVDFSVKPLFDESGAVRNFIVEGIDVTEQRRTEERLHQSEKLDAIGHLAGGIAHDFNNMLGAILGCADLISLEVKDSPEVQKYADLIINSAENAGKLTSKLLTFSRKGKNVAMAIDAHEFVSDALDILDRTVDKKIEIRRRLDARNPMFVGDSAQFENAIINLGVNASHAMPDGGVLALTTSNVVLEAADCAEMPFDLQPGSFLKIEVRDTGSGIPRQYIDRIFEPFFTTKGVGEGTGLGLATVYGMIKEHNGAITVESEVGEGTIFTMYLPTVAAAAVFSKRRLVDELSGSGCILVVDDEPIIRNTAMNMLLELGYEVILAEDGEQGVRLYTEHRDRIDAVIMDMVMPNMSGSTCFRQLKKIDPGVRVILSSGFAQKERMEEMRKAGVFATIEKPYRFQELAETLIEVLGNPTGMNG